MKKTVASGALPLDLNPWLRSKATLSGCLAISILLLTISVSCQDGGTSGGSSGDGGTTACDDGQLYYDGTCVAVSNDIDNCLDRDYDRHKSIFCGGTDLNDLNSSVNPDMDEICGDGFDNK